MDSARTLRSSRCISVAGLFFSIFACLSILLPTAGAGRGRRPHSQADGKTASDCTAGMDQINHCPDQGCGGKYDPQLNKQKNIQSNDKRPIKRGLRWMKALPDPSRFTRKNTNRDELRQLGEGQKITVMAYALLARKGTKETCNCRLTSVKDTDNHIVLVETTLKNPTLDEDEIDSETAEFTPRVRLKHPKLSRTTLQPLIDSANGKLLVRVTGVLMFDTEHFLGHHLNRHNNWEIHPVLKLEYCDAGNTCNGTDDANWKSLDAE